MFPEVFKHGAVTVLVLPCLFSGKSYFLQRGFVQDFLRFLFVTNTFSSSAFLGLLNGEAQQGRITTRQPGRWSRPQETWLAGTAHAACAASGSDHYVKIHRMYYFVWFLNDVVAHNVMVVWGWRKIRIWQCCSLI